MRGLNRLAMVLALVVGVLGLAVAAGPPLGAVPDGWAVDGGIPACLVASSARCYGDTSKPYCDRSTCTWVDNGEAPAGYYCIAGWVVELKDYFPQAKPVTSGGQKGAPTTSTYTCEKSYNCQNPDW